MNEQLKKALASYARSVIGAAASMYAAGITDTKTLAYSLLGAILPVLFRAINPNDVAFGRLPDVKVVEKVLKTAKVVKKAPVKKAVAKKAPAKKK